MMIKKIFLKLLVLFIVFSLYHVWVIPTISYSCYQPMEGDIIFQSLSSLSPLVWAIEGVSESKYSHCGVVFLEEDGEWYVNEAIGEVHSTPLEIFISRGRQEKFSVYRLHPQYQKNIKSFITELKKYQGKPYDFHYKLDDEYIYCSELIYKAYMDATGEALGNLTPLGELNWKPYKDIILIYEGSDVVPLKRKMITPVNLSKAVQLEKIHSYNILY